MGSALTHDGLWRHLPTHLQTLVAPLKHVIQERAGASVAGRPEDVARRAFLDDPPTVGSADDSRCE